MRTVRCDSAVLAFTRRFPPPNFRGSKYQAPTMDFDDDDEGTGPVIEFKRKRKRVQPASGVSDGSGPADMDEDTSSVGEWVSDCTEQK